MMYTEGEAVRLCTARVGLSEGAGFKRVTDACRFGGGVSTAALTLLSVDIVPANGATLIVSLRTSAPKK